MTWDENEVSAAEAPEGWEGADPPDQAHFGRYRLIATLAQGGMANVYLGVGLGPAGFNKLMVVKALRDDVAAHSEDLAAMFLDEARLSARLSHPNIVQTYEIGEHGQRYFMVMEYLEGQPLRVAQRRLGRLGLPLEEELRILVETARGLHHAHELRGLHGEFLGVVHRDVSPQNVFLTYDGQVKLLDFGIAKARDADHLTKVGVIRGKLDYIAPEQVRGEKLDRRADVFSLGAMLWEALTGQRFGGGSRMAEVTKMHRRLLGAEPAAGELNPDLPDTLRNIVERARALDPAERFPTAAAFAEELERFLGTMGMHPTAKTLSDRLGVPFAAERARISGLIEQQVRQAVQSNQRLSALPNLGRSERDSSTGMGTGSLGSAGSSAFLTPDGRTSRTPGSLSPAPAAPSLPPAVTSYPRLSAVKIAAVVTVLGLASGTALLIRKDGQPSALHEPNVVLEPRPAAAAALRAEPTPAPSLQAARPQPRATVHLQIQVAGADAQATLDGSTLTRLPFDADLMRDGILHHLEVSAPGHQTKRILVALDRDQDLTVVLDPLPLDAPHGSRRHSRSGAQADDESALTGPSSLPPAVDEFLPGAKLPTVHRVQAEIDTINPYLE
ncbi:MAG: serine/threonine-protein kinase [Myxococcales bacterium]